jgi:RHS repeat-associated protein
MKYSNFGISKIQQFCFMFIVCFFIFSSKTHAMQTYLDGITLTGGHISGQWSEEDDYSNCFTGNNASYIANITVTGYETVTYDSPDSKTGCAKETTNYNYDYWPDWSCTLYPSSTTVTGYSLDLNPFEDECRVYSTASDMLAFKAETYSRFETSPSSCNTSCFTVPPSTDTKSETWDTSYTFSPNCQTNANALAIYTYPALSGPQRAVFLINGIAPVSTWEWTQYGFLTWYIPFNCGQDVTLVASCGDGLQCSANIKSIVAVHNQCDEGQTQRCYDGPPGTEGVGLCEGGSQTCTNGQWGKCVDEVVPQSEICGDRIDNNCDGQVDEGCNECEDGQTRSCYNGPQETEWIGMCSDGQQTCSGGQWGSCQGETLPGDLQCNGQDNNCDGKNDEEEGACSCSVNVANFSSLNAASGNLLHSEDLFSVKGAGLAASMTLYYRSLDNYSGSVGKKWTHTYDMNLVGIYDGSIIFNEGNGKGRFYTKNGDTYVSQPGDYSTLTKYSDGTFVIAEKDGVKYNFDTNGKITSTVDRNGNTMTFAYTNGNLSTVTDPAGRTVDFSYDTSNRISSIVDPGGALYTLTYTDGMLSTVSNPDGGTWSYTYDNNGFMLTKTDPNNNVTSYTYDSSGRERSATNREGQVKAMTYSPGDNTSQMTEDNGGVWTFKYDTKLGVLLRKADPDGNITSYTYDQNKNMLSKKVPDGSVTSYTYDSNGNMTSMTDALGQTTTYTYNAFGQTTSITDPQGNKTSHTYDVKGDLSSTTDPTGGTTTYAYDSKGNVTSITNAAGQTTTLTYDQYNNVSTITDSTGSTTKLTYDVNGNITSQTDANGNTVGYVYDQFNHLLSVTDSAGNTTKYTYDKNGNRISKTDANGNITYYEYDSEGHLIQVKDALGDITTYTYGGTGCPSCGGGGDKLTSVTDANGNTTSYVYDSSGRKIKDIDALGNVTSYSYDANGNLVSKTDANGHTTYFTYDPLGRIASQTDALNDVVSFAYSPQGQVTKVTDPLRNVTTYTYDAAGRIIKKVSADTGTTTYTYNPTGTMATKTDADGVTIQYFYDGLNRISKIDFPDSSQDITYTYDTCTNGKGRLCAVVDPTGTTMYEFDALGRIVKETHTVLGVTYVTGYSYDKANTIATIVYPSGRRVEYDYDQLNRVMDVSSTMKDIVPLATNVAYDPVSNMKSVAFGNGLEQSWTYDSDDRISSIVAGSVMNLSYTYDPVGNITSISDGLDPSKSKTYSYDAVNRLSGAAGPWGSLAWTYDANGNRLSQTDDTTYSYSYSANRLMSINNTQYKYDNNGNTTSDGMKKFIYNQNQRLVMVTETDKTLGQYMYNAKGQRVIKETGSASANSASAQNTVYHYDLSGNLIEETDGNGKLITDYVYLNGKPLAMITKQGNGETTYYYHDDHLGTPAVMTDKLQKEVWNVQFDPFGNEVQRNGRQGSYIRDVTNNLRFPGQYYDSETGLNYNYYRDYNPVTGRYVEADPIGIEHGSNSLFAYVGNNTTGRIDSFGLKCCSFIRARKYWDPPMISPQLPSDISNLKVECLWDCQANNILTYGSCSPLEAQNMADETKFWYRCSCRNPDGGMHYIDGFYWIGRPEPDHSWPEPEAPRVEGPTE